MKTYVILENIRSAHNVGSVFRTADGAGVSKIYLVGHSPCPTDRFGREQPEIKKTSLGASKTVAWEHCENSIELLKTLKREGVIIVSVEQHKDAKPFNDHVQETDTVYVFGNETDGVPEETLEASDVIVDIPMGGTKESLNVSVAAGIILFQQ